MATTKPVENSPPSSPPTQGTFFKLGEIRLPTDEDFEYVAALADDYEGWTQKYNKNRISVWTRNTQGSEVKVVKVRYLFNSPHQPLCCAVRCLGGAVLFVVDVVPVFECVCLVLSVLSVQVEREGIKEWRRGEERWGER